MPSIQQIIAEIQLADDLPPNHKVKAVQIIRDAEQRLKLKGLQSKPRKVTNGKNLMTLQDWEKENTLLNVGMLENWVKSNGLCPQIISRMIGEFRAEMIAKGKQYANFKAAFTTYMIKGYLSRRLSACTLQMSPFNQETIIDNKGVTL